MPYLSSLKDGDDSIAVFAQYPQVYAPFVKFAENVFRERSSLPERERQIIYAYVSKLNGCEYCFGGHNALAESYGAPADLVEQLVSDIDRAPVDDSLRALVRYAKKLTRTPHRINDRDARSVLAAGWDEDALHMLVLVCAMANFMNRLADGVGLVADPDTYEQRVRNAREVGYSAIFERMVAARSHATGGSE